MASAEVMTMVTRFPRLSLCLLLLLAASTCFAAPAKWAVVIGVSRYADGGVPNLDYAEQDARELRDALVMRAGFRADHVLLLLGRDATYVNVKKAYEEWLAKNVEEGDLVLTFFSGHGSQVPEVGGKDKGAWQDVICPYDVKKADPASAIKSRDIGYWLSRLASDNIVVIWDSCLTRQTAKGFTFSNIARPKSERPPSSAERDFSRFKLITACAADQEALEAPDLASGVFSHFLTRALEGAADSSPADGVVTLSEAVAYLQVQVAQYAADKLGREQNPCVRGPEILDAAAIAQPLGRVIEVSGDTVVVDVGSPDRVKDAASGQKPDRFNVFPTGRPLASGLRPVGVVEVVSVLDGRSTARVISRNGSIEVGCPIADLIPEVTAREATLRINATPAAKVVIDGEWVGETPLTLRLAAGTHHIRLEPRNHEKAYETNITLAAGEERKLAYHFTGGG